MSDLVSGDLIRRIALGVVNNPAATLDGIATMAGISRSSIYRMFGSRDNLYKVLTDSADAVMIRLLRLLSTDKCPGELLPEIASAVYENWELIAYLYMAQPKCGEEGYQVWTRFCCAMDSYFLRGQKLGVFRIDITASTFTEIFFSMTCGLFTAERRGRVARKDCLPWMIEVFFRGTK